MKFLPQKHRGFTLIELLVVIAIIGVLTAVVMQNINTARVKTRNTQRLNEIDQVVKAFELYASGRSLQFPTSSGTWRCVGQSSTETCWKGIFSGLDSLRSVVLQNMPGFKGDPLVLSGCVGGFIYNSSAESVPGVGYGGNPPGAYISWVQESQGGTSLCGRGFVRNASVCSGKLTQCMIYLDERTP